MSTTQWIEFQGRKSAADVAEPRVTIQRGGSLGLNLAAYRLLGEPSHVSYVTDGSKKRFGIKPAAEDVPYAYPVRSQQSARSFVVGAKLFLKWAGIPFGEQIRICSMRMEDGIGIVEISEPSTKKAKAG